MEKSIKQNAKMVKKKRKFGRESKLNGIIIIIGLQLILLISQQTTSQFDEKDIATWTPQNINKVLEMNPAERNAVLNDIGKSGSELNNFLDIRNQVIENIAVELSQKTTNRRLNDFIVRRKVEIILQKIGIGDNELSKASDYIGVSLENLKGFDNVNLKFKEGNVITDGNIELDLEKLPIGVTEIEYVPASNGEKSKFIYRFKSGGAIETNSGKINEDLTYENENIPESLEEKGRIQLIPGEGRIIIDDKGNFRIERDAKVQVGERVFEKNGDIGEFKIVEGGYFKGKNIKITTKEAEIKIGDKETDIVFKGGDYSNLGQYVQIFDSGEMGFISPEIPKDIKIITMKGENIEVKLLKEGLGDDKVAVNGNGENLLVRNGDKVLYKIGGDKIYRDRIPASGEEVKAEIVNPQKQGQSVETTVTEQGSETTATVNDKKRVCIGRFCEVGNLKRMATGEDPYPKPAGYSPWFYEKVVTNTKIYTTQEQAGILTQSIKEFVSQNGKKPNGQELSELFYKYVQDYEITTTTVYDDLTKEQVGKGFDKQISSMGLDKETIASARKVKAEVFTNLINGKVPVGTIITITSRDGKETSHGLVSIIISEKNYQVIVPSSQIRKLTKQKIVENPLFLSEIIKNVDN